MLTKKSSRLQKSGNLILDESPISKKKSIDQRENQVIEDEYVDDFAVSQPEISDSFNEEQKANSSLPNANVGSSPQKLP